MKAWLIYLSTFLVPHFGTDKAAMREVEPGVLEPFCALDALLPGEACDAVGTFRVLHWLGFAFPLKLVKLEPWAGDGRSESPAV